MTMRKAKTDTSLFVAADIHALDGQNKLAAVLSLVAADKTAVQPKTVLLGGDYVGGGGPPSSEEERLARWQPVFRLTDVRREITDIFGKDVDTYFTYGSHDKNEVSGGRDFFCGPADCGECYLYGISFSQMRFDTERQRTESGYDGTDVSEFFGGNAQTAADHFLKWVSALNDRKPIFVMSHMPLHAHRGDNLGGDTWCRALNFAAQQHKIFFFFAHNHSTERRTPYDREFYLVPVDGTIPVQGPQREQQREFQLNFTYLNAGYILNGCGTLLTLSDANADGKPDTLTIRRYSLDPGESFFGDTHIPSPYVSALICENTAC